MNFGKGTNPVAGNDPGVVCCFAHLQHISEWFAKATDGIGSISFVQRAPERALR
jgi:hypothetical protein